MDLGVWLVEHPEAALRNLKPIRSAKVLEPGVYYNMGTGMVDRIYTPRAWPWAQDVPHKQRSGIVGGGDPAHRARRKTEWRQDS